ncbi:hypothetical protein [Mesorhizobium sp. WSM2239]|uniref:RiboL-PSP-HEPN domain-containing protein n=2 Tax=unclassified Mesorhizobium TaxID=325217 RepID=A0AAU8D488_9HYPH
MEEPQTPRQLVTSGVTEEQQSQLRSLGDLVLSAYIETGKMRASIALAEHSISILNDLMRQDRESGYSLSTDIPAHISLVQHWPPIAATYAISTLYQFREVLNGFGEWMDASTIKPWLVEPDFVSNALALFEKNFPKWEATRHATAHSAEIRRKVDKNLHSAPLSKGPVRKNKGSTMIMQDTFDGRTMYTTRRGELLKFEATPENYQRLLAVYNLLLSGARVDTSRPLQS